MSADGLLASGLPYSSAFPGCDWLSLVAWWTFVSGYSCGTATDSHRVPGPSGPVSADIYWFCRYAKKKRTPLRTSAESHSISSPPSGD